MAYGEQFSADSPLAFTIHVWPTTELAARSLSWPEQRHQNFAHVAWLLALAAATQILEGGSFVKQQIKVSTIFGRVTFTIAQTGTTVHITISEFSGPHAPGPNGGLGKQPACIDGLVLGLRGADRYFHLVVFHGTIPKTPYFTSYEQDTPIHSIFASLGDVGVNKTFYPNLISELDFPRSAYTSMQKVSNIGDRDAAEIANGGRYLVSTDDKDRLHLDDHELQAPTRPLLFSSQFGAGDMVGVASRIAEKRTEFPDQFDNRNCERARVFGCNWIQ